MKLSLALAIGALTTVALAQIGGPGLDAKCLAEQAACMALADDSTTTCSAVRANCQSGVVTDCHCNTALVACNAAGESDCDIQHSQCWDECWPSRTMSQYASLSTSTPVSTPLRVGTSGVPPSITTVYRSTITVTATSSYKMATASPLDLFTDTPSSSTTTLIISSSSSPSSSSSFSSSITVSVATSNTATNSLPEASTSTTSASATSTSASTGAANRIQATSFFMLGVSWAVVAFFL